MAELYLAMLLGHFIGDYLLQGRTMAIAKSASGWRGLAWCLFHCMLYTFAVAGMSWQFSPLFLGLVFLSHFPIDRWSLASRWLKIIRGRDLLQAFDSPEKYRDIDLSFSCLVYAVVDNTMHALLLWFIAKFMF